MLTYTKNISTFDIWITDTDQVMTDNLIKIKFLPTTYTQLSTTQPYLNINNKCVDNNIISTLRKHSREQEIQLYLCTKNEWQLSTFEDIMWQAHGHALQQFTGHQRKTIIQLLHNWLPFNTSHSLQLLGKGRLCPICNNIEETTNKFLHCDHQSYIKQCKDASTNSKSRLTKYNKQLHHHIE
jgi:hypothetical protein